LGFDPSAAADTLIVALVSLAPVLFGRMVLVFGPTQSKEEYWAFLTNGQMAFYSMGSLAALLLICLRGKLTETANLVFGVLSVMTLFFLMVLVGVDPTLKAQSFNFVGRAVLIIYVGALLCRMIAEAMKNVGHAQALNAGAKAPKKLTEELSKRKAGGQG
jgi:hypothetical protein